MLSSVLCSSSPLCSPLSSSSCTASPTIRNGNRTSSLAGVGVGVREGPAGVRASSWLIWTELKEVVEPRRRGGTPCHDKWRSWSSAVCSATAASRTQVKHPLPFTAVLSLLLGVLFWIFTVALPAPWQRDYSIFFLSIPQFYEDCCVWIFFPVRGLGYYIFGTIEEVVRVFSEKAGRPKATMEGIVMEVLGLTHFNKPFHSDGFPASQRFCFSGSCKGCN